MAHYNETRPTAPEKTHAPLLSYVIPLRPETATTYGCDVTLALPRDLTADEAKRLSAVLATLAVEWPPPAPAAKEGTP
jgi:hypothetical protein